MPKESIVQKWLDQVAEDISSAECLYNGGHWLYTAFLCHQAIEKSLKAYFVDKKDCDPRYTHSHARLLDDCGLTGKLTDAHQRLVDLMVPMYIEARYPEQKERVARMLNKDACKYILDTTKELTKWIEQRLPSSRH